MCVIVQSYSAAGLMWQGWKYTGIARLVDALVSVRCEAGDTNLFANNKHLYDIVEVVQWRFLMVMEKVLSF